MLTDLEIARVDPAAFLRVERMLRSRLDFLAVDGQVGNDRIRIE
ncbi:MAG TPA: hypothetical protein VMT24_13615 [Aggregatilineaceae bacterium]|nr:hypothetical protein [Aggregatilineaceae bacterium]